MINQLLTKYSLSIKLRPMSEIKFQPPVKPDRPGSHQLPWAIFLSSQEDIFVEPIKGSIFLPGERRLLYQVI